MPPPAPLPGPDLDPDALRTGRRVCGWTLLVAPLPVAVLGTWAGLRHDDALLAALGLFQAWFALALLGVMRAQSLRLRAARAPATGPARAHLRGARLLGLCAGLVGVAAPFAPALLSSGAARLPGLLGGLAATPLMQAGGSPQLPWGLAVFGAVALALGAAALALLVPYLHQLRPAALPEAPALARWCRAGTWLMLLGVLECVQHAFGDTRGHAVAAAVVLGLLAVLGLEIAVRALRGPGVRPAAPPPHGPEAFTEALLLRLLCSRFNPSASLFGVLAEGLGIDLKSAWALRFVRRAMLPLVGVLTLVGWLCSGLVTVDTFERGVHERFGRLVSRTPLEPGLHLVMPWPIDRVQRVSVDRVRTATIGYRGQRADASMLWTSQHAEEEHKLLVGDGRDLVSINATLHYRVRDPVEYLYTSEHPEVELAALADRVLLRRTVDRSLDQLLGENLAEFAASVRDQIDAQARERELGLEVVDFSLSGLHPPVQVAEDYQDVVASQIDRVTHVLFAERDRAEILPAAEGDAAAAVNRARGEALERRARAAGESSAFTRLLQAVLIDAGLYRFRRHLEVLEEALAGRPFHLLDHRILRDGGTLWLLD